MGKIRFSIVVALFSVVSVLSQNNGNAKVSGSLYINPVKAEDKPLGSPYSEISFAKANVSKINTETYMRYNTFADEFEFITPKNDTLILDKLEDFAQINFMGINKKYELLAYTDNKKLVYGYLIISHETNGFTLYKKENVNYTEAKIAKTSFELNMPARFTKVGDTFFFKNKSGTTTAFPDGKKALLKAFPEKKSAIEAFLNENKLDFKSEKDLQKLMDLIAR